MMNDLFSWGATSQVGPRLPRCWGFQITHNQTHTHTHTHTHTISLSLSLSSERVVNPSQRPLPTQLTTNTTDEYPCPKCDMIPEIKRLHTYASDSAAKGFGIKSPAQEKESQQAYTTSKRKNSLHKLGNFCEVSTQAPGFIPKDMANLDAWYLYKQAGQFAQPPL